MNQKEVKNIVTVPCHLPNRTLIFCLNIRYVTCGDQLIGINSLKIENPYPGIRLDVADMLNAGINTLITRAVQSEHAYRQWQRLDKENSLLRNEISKKLDNSEDNNNLQAKVSALIEQGIITQEQLDNALDNSRKK